MKTNNNVVALFTEPYKIEIVNVPMINVPANYAYIEYLYCAICGGDYSIYCGRRREYPKSLGHEFVGRVLSIGENVNDLSVGQYVISDLNYRCNKCKYCMAHLSHLCIKNNDEYFSNRGFAKYANIHSNYLLKIKPPAFLPRACLMEPLSCVIHACNSTNIQQGMKILICGGGGIGMLFLFYLCRIVKNIEVTIAEIEIQKLKLLCNHFPVKPYCRHENVAYDLIIDCSNSISGLKFSLNTVQKGGNICILSHLYGLDTSFVYESLCKKELHCIFPLRNGERSNLIQAADLINNYWKEDDDTLLYIYDNIETAFKEKSKSQFCKQIFQCTTL